jgi:hypothetical protein
MTEHRQERRQETFLVQASKWAGIIIPIIILFGFIFGWMTTFSKIPALCAKIDNQLEPKVNQLDTKMAVFEERILNMDNNIKDIKDLLKVMARKGGDI